MITFPVGFVATKYDGYYWNVPEQKLYSIKVDGVLKPMKYSTGGIFYGYVVVPGYTVSVKGKRRKLTLEYLQSLNNNQFLTETVKVI